MGEQEIPFSNIPLGTSSNSAELVRFTHFLDKTLPQFHYKLGSDEDEDDYTDNLETFLTKAKKKRENNDCEHFEFKLQNLTKRTKRGKRPEADIGLWICIEGIDDETIAHIEAKRLPSPSKTIEYVTGKTGGILRFKKKIHGVNRVGTWLPHNFMVGYVENESLAFWETTINAWIQSLAYANPDSEGIMWVTDERLNQRYINSRVASFNSEHLLCDGSDTVHLTHFWIDMNTIP